SRPGPRIACPDRSTQTRTPTVQPSAGTGPTGACSLRFAGGGDMDTLPGRMRGCGHSRDASTILRRQNRGSDAGPSGSSVPRGVQCHSLRGRKKTPRPAEPGGDAVVKGRSRFAEPLLDGLARLAGALLDHADEAVVVALGLLQVVVGQPAPELLGPAA